MANSEPRSQRDQDQASGKRSWGDEDRKKHSAAMKWTPERRAKFQATMAKKRGEKPKPAHAAQPKKRQTAEEVDAANTRASCGRCGG